jgi:predicted unusual protein kinase regulating ubiquinone biosynthesis (AarF/ABC1/UbiB family)
MAGRAAQRWSTFARAAARRLVAATQRMLLTDPGKDPGDSAERAGAVELARSAGELKGGMAKLAQLMAYQLGPGSAHDAEARRALGALWDHAPGADTAAIRRVVTEDLGQPPEVLFAAWSDAPMAAASLGQVHAAIGKDGTRWAVKVQYPGVAEALRSDLESARLLRRLAGAQIGGALSDEAIAALREAVLGELDYLAEARWLERFRRAFLREPGMVVPRLARELSARRVLTAELIEGRPLTAFAEDPATTDAERAAAALTLFRFAWGGPLRHRLLNADPNPGNYLVCSDGRIAFLDFGCCAEIDEALVDTDRKLWHALLERDAEMLRYRVHEEGLITRAHARTLDSSTYRDWERYLAGPFLARGPFAWTPGYAAELARLTSQLVQAGGMTVPAAALLLWRQRLGVAAVLGALGPRADFGRALAELLSFESDA